eukprot:c22134_g1_i1 orf=122-964(+)
MKASLVAHVILLGLLFLPHLFLSQPIIGSGDFIEKQQAEPFCRNTVQGRYLLSDDNGYVCSVTSISPSTGCCPKFGEQFPCLGCNLSTQCCNSYEYCVACCLSPTRTSRGLATQVKVAHQVSAGTYKTVFDFCLGQCRHSSRSVVHENVYVSENHHCFFLPLSSSGNYSVEQQGFGEEAELSSISIVISRRGQSCYLACKVKGQTCMLNKLPSINNCFILRKYFNCRGSCMASIGTDQPAEVAASSPRHLNPGACLFNTEEHHLSCHGSHPHTRRLCPCG